MNRIKTEACVSPAQREVRVLTPSGFGELKLDGQVDDFVSSATSSLPVKNFREMQRLLQDPQVEDMRGKLKAGRTPESEYWLGDKILGASRLTVRKEGEKGLAIEIGLQTIRVDGDSATIHSHIPFSTIKGPWGNGCMTQTLYGKLEGSEYQCTRKDYMFQSLQV